MAHTEEQLEAFENTIFLSQQAWILENFGKEAAGMANYGWGVSSDDRKNSTATKVYGHGVLTTEADYCDVASICHCFEEA